MVATNHPNMARIEPLRWGILGVANIAVNKVIPAMRFVPATNSGRKAAAKVQIPFAFAIGKD